MGERKQSRDCVNIYPGTELSEPPEFPLLFHSQLLNTHGGSSAAPRPAETGFNKGETGKLEISWEEFSLKISEIGMTQLLHSKRS
ncbi:hypothetical protein WG66_010365 [Moniliophthora roreri]|nr:hypothetical protein WG66_010365 [Moniliophthora roreri]